MDTLQLMKYTYTGNKDWLGNYTSSCLVVNTVECSGELDEGKGRDETKEKGK